MLRFSRERIIEWNARHQLPLNFALHLLGIPIAFVGLVFLGLGDFDWGLAFLAAGYLPQYVGHRAEGNDMGEVVLVKRLLGLPAIPIAPSRVSVAPTPSRRVARSA